MKVVGIIPRSGGVQVAFLVGTSDKFEVSFYDEWTARPEEDGRLDDYVEIRTRLVQYLHEWHPDCVCIAPLEPAAIRYDPEHPERRPPMSWFHTAELRGVVAEASSACGVSTEFRGKQAINRTIGGRKAAGYVEDGAFWTTHDVKMPKKYRDAAVLALSKIKETEKETAT